MDVTDAATGRANAQRPRLDKILIERPFLLDRFATGMMRLQPGSPVRRRLVSWIVKRSFAAQERLDVDFASLVYEPDVEVRLAGADGLGLASEYRGHAGWEQFYDDLYDSFVSPAFRVTRLLDGGDRVALEFVFDARGRASGATAVLTVTTALRLSERGKIGRQELFWGGTWEDALEAAGLRRRETPNAPVSPGRSERKDLDEAG